MDAIESIAGWNFSTNVLNGKVPKGGVVLTNVRHNVFNLAQEIRVIKLWFSQLSTGKDNPVSLILGPDDFVMTNYEAKNAGGKKPPFQFSAYETVAWIKAEFISKKPVIDKGSRVKITQEYLFTEYSNQPAHEPSGNLMAARIFPLIKFEFPDENQNTKLIFSVRVDYRFHLDLDTFIIFPRPATALQTESFKKHTQQVGLFKDNDVPDTTGGNIADITFSAAEKPAKYEVLSDGLRNGLNYISDPVNGPTPTWDNVHAWGGYKDSHYPSTPGAFHAAHLHWRWAKILQALNQPQFTSNVLGGVLLDPNIPNQNIKFAVITNSDKLPKDVFDHSTPQFEDFVYNTKGKTPEEISDGADLFLYYSNEAFRNPGMSAPFRGCFFIQGVFFAHELEPGLLSPTGSQQPFYKSPSRPDKKFDRHPQK